MMLAICLATFSVGPALVLIFGAGLAAIILAFGLYPMYSVAAIWFVYFLTSALAQVRIPIVNKEKPN